LDLRKKIDINRFLKDFKKIASEKKIKDAKPNDMDMGLSELGLTREIRNNIIFDLTYENYCDGPINDRDKPGSLWIFGKHYNGELIYIKIKIVAVENIKEVVCISFHRAEREMNFPFKGN